MIWVKCWKAWGAFGFQEARECSADDVMYQRMGARRRGQCLDRGVGEKRSRYAAGVHLARRGGSGVLLQSCSLGHV